MTTTATSLAVPAEMAVRAILRRRLTVAILVVMPIAFYFVTHESVGRAVRSLAFGLSWSMSTLAFFAAIGGRRLEPRLGLAGWGRTALVAGRLGGLTALAAVLIGLFAALVAVDQTSADMAPITVVFAVTAGVAIALGTAVGTVIDRELEGTLVLFFLAGLQAVVNPFEGYARALPFWSSRQLSTWAVDGSDAGSLGSGLTHAAVVVALCGSVVTAVLLRGRRARHSPLG